MRRYWIESEFSNDQLQISGDSFHHIFDVCRQEVGSKFEVLGFQDEAILVEVVDVKKKSALVKKISSRKIAPLPKPLLNLVLCIPRYPVLESCLERLVELGVNSVQLVYSDFSFIRSESSLPSQKFDRWEKIIKSATQQCGRSELMKLHKPISLKEFLTINRNHVQNGLFAYEGSSVRHLRQELKRIQDKWAPTGPSEHFWVFVGGEGGFSKNEVDHFKEIGLGPITLGDQVLRVETACLALVSILKYELFDFSKNGGTHGEGSL